MQGGAANGSLALAGFSFGGADGNRGEAAAYDMNEFPTLNSRPTSSGSAPGSAGMEAWHLCWAVLGWAGRGEAGLLTWRSASTSILLNALIRNAMPLSPFAAQIRRTMQQPNPEFSIQSKEFPALPGNKGEMSSRCHLLVTLLAEV